MRLPNESVEAYKARYRKGMEPLRDRIFYGTAALNTAMPADLSREEGDFFILEENSEQMDNFHVGRWLTGFGFVHVVFPKATSRSVTDEEWEFILSHPVEMV